MARLKIGSYIIDAAETGSTSTTPGAMLNLEEEMVYAGTDDAGEFMGFSCYVTAATEAALKTAVAAVVAAVEGAGGQNIVYEETTGTTQYEIVAAQWAKVKGSAKASFGNLSAEVLIGFTASRIAPQSSGAGDFAGQAGPVNWQYQRMTSGQSACVVRISFQGDGTTSAREHAVAAANTLDSTANYPTWLNTKLKQVDAVFEWERAENATDPVPETAYRVGILTLTFAGILPSIAGNAAFDNVRNATYSVTKTPSAALDSRSGDDPGFDVTIAALLTVRTDADTTFDSGATADTTAASLRSIALAALAVIKTDAETRMGEGGFNPFGAPQINVDTASGSVGITASYTTGSSTKVREWNETTTITNNERIGILRATDGGEWVFREAGGPERLMDHSLRVAALSVKPYSAPSLAGSWERISLSVNLLNQQRYAGLSTTVFITEGRSQWRWVNPSPQKGGVAKTTVTGLAPTTVGTGLL